MWPSGRVPILTPGVRSPPAPRLRRTRLPRIVLLGGIVGCIAGFGLEVWYLAVAYQLNVGGRPFISWPQFIPVMFDR